MSAFGYRGLQRDEKESVLATPSSSGPLLGCDAAGADGEGGGTEVLL